MGRSIIRTASRTGGRIPCKPSEWVSMPGDARRREGEEETHGDDSNDDGGQLTNPCEEVCGLAEGVDV